MDALHPWMHENGTAEFTRQQPQQDSVKTITKKEKTKAYAEKVERKEERFPCGVSLHSATDSDSEMMTSSRLQEAQA
ncbi:hypothetical protein V5799_028440 [Amblyomma americanum]|uniref:Uncharacterized protein n=1 Tax=Amblyomma americanum TaxID=6943 RepID=A0AAQ4DCV2_AMBAM